MRDGLWTQDGQKFWITRVSPLLRVERIDQSTGWSIQLVISGYADPTVKNLPMYIGTSDVRRKAVTVPPWSRDLVATGLCGNACHQDGTTEYCVEVVNGVARVVRLDEDSG